MDKPKAVEDLRATLAAMSRAEVRALATRAGLACSTVEKFRLGHIGEPRLSKLEKLRSALSASKQPKPTAKAAGSSERRTKEARA